uniref:Uncharacterized protein n=1 Tax=Anopheles maculatus TaxID=74869 RepID=A0A182T4A5_9DIPT
MFYCLYMCCVCTVYCIAPLCSNVSGYMSAMKGQANGSTAFEFNLYLEQGFYWLDNRTSLFGYCICTVFMFPLMYLCAYTGTVKVVTVFNIIKYCQVVIQAVVLKLEYLKTLRDISKCTDTLSQVRDLHQRALRCAELLELVLQPLLLMQFVLCILIWCTMMLYFSVSSNNVGKALYETDWIDYDGTMRKNLAFMIMRAQCRKRITLGDGSKRLYFPIVFTAFCTTVVVPKLVTHYSDLETFICSMAELVFVGNVNCGTMLLWLEYASFAQFIEQTTSLTKYLITSFAVYFQSMGQFVNINETSGNLSDQHQAEFTLHMEEEFYGLEQRTNIIHYILFTSVILPMMLVTAVSVHTKLLTICCSTLYCETLLHIVTIKVDNLHRMPWEAARDELADIIQ